MSIIIVACPDHSACNDPWPEALGLAFHRQCQAAYKPGSSKLRIHKANFCLRKEPTIQFLFT